MQTFEIAEKQCWKRNCNSQTMKERAAVINKGCKTENPAD